MSSYSYSTPTAGGPMRARAKCPELCVCVRCVIDLTTQLSDLLDPVAPRCQAAGCKKPQYKHQICLACYRVIEEALARIPMIKRV